MSTTDAVIRQVDDRPKASPYYESVSIPETLWRWMPALSGAELRILLGLLREGISGERQVKLDYRTLSRLERWTGLLEHSIQTWMGHMERCGLLVRRGDRTLSAAACYTLDLDWRPKARGERTSDT